MQQRTKTKRSKHVRGPRYKLPRSTQPVAAPRHTSLEPDASPGRHSLLTPASSAVDSGCGWIRSLNLSLSMANKRTHCLKGGWNDSDLMVKSTSLGAETMDGPQVLLHWTIDFIKGVTTRFVAWDLAPEIKQTFHKRSRAGDGLF